ncbi:MAG TPA: divergent PAP2 family protein [Candidatus Saccharibacteria bacterium]|nr:divergent PAP2 family protein [Candidatus Saccharibacteria bacterium]
MPDIPVSSYVIAPVLGWVVAQILKHLFNARLRKDKKAYYSPLIISGGMPSAHSAAVVALLVVVGTKDGIESAVFGIALLFAAIVMYDAMMVRRSSGDQGVILAALIKEQKSSVRLPRIAKGHTPLEVIVGAVIGLGVGFAALFITI